MAGTVLRGERLQIMLTKEELKALDTWRFDRRMPSRAAAVREVLKRGLQSDGFLVAEDGARSASFGVVTEPAQRKASDKA
jgi:metal-responsive CopG/Arc/MetJ family transcriptional regulator